MTAYAKWDAPTFDLTLEIPGGSLPDDILQSIRDKGYTVEVSADSGGCSYIIRNVSDGTPINQVQGHFQQPVSHYGLEFQDWYEMVETAWPDNLPEDWYYFTVQEATNTHSYLQKGSLFETGT